MLILRLIDKSISNEDREEKGTKEEISSMDDFFYHARSMILETKKEVNCTKDVIVHILNVVSSSYNETSLNKYTQISDPDKIIDLVEYLKTPEGEKILSKFEVLEFEPDLSSELDITIPNEIPKQFEFDKVSTVEDDESFNMDQIVVEEEDEESGAE